GRTFVDQLGTQTGIVLVNATARSASVYLILRDSSGKEVARGAQVLSPGQHLSRYVRELFSVAPGFLGSLTFDSDQPLGAITLRESRNRYDEPVYATLPVIDLTPTPSSDPIVFPHVAIGGGYQTQLVLINRSAQPLQGKIRFVDSDGQPLTVQSGSNVVVELP